MQNNKETLEQQYHPLWLEGMALYEKIGQHEFGSLPYLEARVVYLENRVAYSQMVLSVNVPGVQQELKEASEVLAQKKARYELEKRFEAIRTPQNGAYVNYAIKLLKLGRTANELDNWLEHRQSIYPEDEGYQQLTNVVIAYIGETEQF